VSARVVRWSKAVCAVLSEPRPTPPSLAAKTVANGRAADLFFCDLFANLHLHLEQMVDLERHKVDLEGVVEVRDL
jgi:hypothetical protein